MLKRILLPLVAALVALAPSVLNQSSSRAAGSTTITWTDQNLGPKTLTVPTGTNGCTGPLVTVYGSSALKTFVLGTAADYCATFTTASAKQTAPDVEYVGGGDSCPGVDIAADDTADNVLGVSDVFSTGCTGTFARNASKVKDNLANVNAVEAITLCNGASGPQGGSPFAGSAANQCLGSAKASNTCGTGVNATSDYPKDFPYPDDVSVGSSQSLWAQGGTGVSDIGLLGGCKGETPFAQVRVPGSGTRITFCDNIFGVFSDGQCVGNAQNAGGTPTPDAPTTGTMLTDVCGNPFTSPATGPVDLVGTVGHTSRAGVLIDPRSSTAGKTTDSPTNNQPLTNCGLVALAGHTAWNQACDPTTVTAASPYSSTDSTGAVICKGDLEIANNQYPAWGYEHLFTNSGKASSAPIVAYLSYLASPAQVGRADQYGFMKTCRMNWNRTVDGGPVAPQAAGC